MRAATSRLRSSAPAGAPSAASKLAASHRADRLPQPAAAPAVLAAVSFTRAKNVSSPISSRSRRASSKSPALR